MKKRCLSLYVENDVGVLAKIAGLFSGKAYNIESLTVGSIIDQTVSRITIGLHCSDAVYEQIKKQLNRCVGVIKVMDFTDQDVAVRELVFVRFHGLTEAKKQEIIARTAAYGALVIDETPKGLLLQLTASDSDTARFIEMVRCHYPSAELLRSGLVAIEKCK